MIIYPNYNKMAKAEYTMMERLYRLHHKPLMSIDTIEEIITLEEEIRKITNYENKPSFKFVVLVDNAPGEVFYSIKTLFRNCLSTFNLYLTSSFENLDNRLMYINKRLGSRYIAQLPEQIMDLDNPESKENEIPSFMPVWELELPARDKIMELYGDESNGFVIDDNLLKRYYLYNKIDGTDRFIINDSLVFHHMPSKQQR